MPLPETIAMRFTEDDAGYVTVRPVVKQTFRLPELADMVVSVTGKNAVRVQQIFRAGTVVYNGYRYWWDGFASKEDEITGLLALFPDDDPERLFNPAKVTAVSLEIGGAHSVLWLASRVAKLQRRSCSARGVHGKSCSKQRKIQLRATRSILMQNALTSIVSTSLSRWLLRS